MTKDAIIAIYYSLKNICKLPIFSSFENMIGANGTSGYSWQSRKNQAFRWKSDEVDPDYPSDTVTTMVHVSLCEGAADANSERIHPSSGTSGNNGLRVAVCGNHGKCGLCSQKSSENLYTWERGGGTMNWARECFSMNDRTL